MRLRARLTLIQLFVVATLAAAAAVGATFYAFLESSRREILARSDTLRDAAARHIDERVTAELSIPLGALTDVEHGLQLGVFRADDLEAVEARLFSELIDHPSLSNASLTHADLQGFAADGEARVGPDDRWQVAVYRTSADPGSPIVTRRVSRRGDELVTDMRLRPAGAGLLGTPFQPGKRSDDPTGHATFTTTVSRSSYGKAIWTDLSYTELDQALPQAEQRIVVTVQKAVEDTPGHFAGVVRVGLLAATIDALPRMARMDEPQRVILCDGEGRLVARLDRNDAVEPTKDKDLRIAPRNVPPEVAAALAIAPRSGAIDVGGTRYLVTFRQLETSQHWSVGIIVPEDYYTRDLQALRTRFLWTFLATVTIALLAGGLVLRLLRRALARVVDATGQMRRFDFSPAPAAETPPPLREVAEVMEGIERAKTSMRTLGKYAPVELVRRLYESNREPELGGELMEISMLFTDIEGFTSLSEKLSPGALATALGAYFEAMTRALQSTGATVDKFIGDAVMAFWNAPTPQPDHSRRACRAVLACMAATKELYASDAWKGLPPLFTRHGLHRARVMVGHFGAPERFSYTALGDGVNLAARLEPLCKQYGVAVLASDSIVEQAGDEFAFRLVDRVAVKGRDEAVQVFELLGVRGQCEDAAARARVYEQGLARYFARDFAGARDVLQSLPDDPPSRVMCARCETMAARPPPEDWNGVYVAKSK